MRSLRSWAPALVAFALSIPAPQLFAQSTDEDLRKEIQQLREKLEQLEKKLEQQPAAAAPQATTPTQREQALQQKVDDLDQQVRVLGRKQELAQEEAAAEKDKNKS